MGELVILVRGRVKVVGWGWDLGWDSGWGWGWS